MSSKEGRKKYSQMKDLIKFEDFIINTIKVGNNI